MRSRYLLRHVNGFVVSMLAGLVAALGGGDESTSRRDALEARSLVVPVLMYHHIREPGPTMSDRLSQRFAVSPAEFAKQLDYLQRHGFTTINCDQLAAALYEGGELPPKPIMLTFDDAWREQYTIAFPLLKSRGMVGVFYVHTGVVGDDPDRGYATWADLCEMYEAGMDIQSHTITHPSLPGVEPAKLDDELQASKATIERVLGAECISIAYPFGDFTEREMRAAARAGYRFAFTTEVGLVHDVSQPYEIGRTIVTYTDTLDDFAIKLAELDGGRALLDYRPSITRQK